MARKTNKTAHVLNLITNSPKENEDDIVNKSAVSQDNDIFEDAPKPVEIDQTESTNDTSNKKELSKPSNTPAAPVVQILYNEHDPLSDLIKNVLEETSEESETVNASAVEIKPSIINSAAIIEEPKKVEDAKVFDFSLEFDEDGNEIEHIEPESSEEPEVLEQPQEIVEPPDHTIVDDHIPEKSDDCDCSSTQLLEQLEMSQNQHFHDRKDLNSMVDLDFKYVNVYEIIVQDKLLDYMKKFDICMCDRCIIDTFALAVTSLPTKIVVVDKAEIFPLVNFFEVKNTAMISTALIKACMTVKDNPNHGK